MEVKVVKEGKTLRSGQIVFDATVSLTESGTFDTMEKRDSFVKDKTDELNNLVEMKRVEEPKKKVKKT